MLTAQEIYTAVRTLSLPERLRLAALMLEELAQSPSFELDPTSLAGYSDAWTDEDIHDLRQFSAHHFNPTETVSETEQPALCQRRRENKSRLRWGRD